MKKLTEAELLEKWGAKREAFKEAIKVKMEANPALTMLAIKTWTAAKHRTHIHEIWELLGFHHKEAYKDYCDKLHGTALTGTDEFTDCLYWVDKELFVIAKEIPETYVREDAKDVAYTIVLAGTLTK